MKITRVMVMASLLLIGLWGATQIAAAQMDYDETLSGRLFEAEGWSLYAPWALVVWSMDPAGADEQIVGRAFGGFMLYAIVTIGIVALSTWGRTPRVKRFGAEGWGTVADMKRAGLLADAGTVVGVHRKRLLTYNGPEHQLVSGASRSGKGVGHVVPTLLCWPGSVLVYDIKNELWDITAGFRSKFQHCVYFNPTKADSVRFNPLLEVRKGPNEVRDVQNIVEILINPDGSKKTLNVWDQNASQFLTALILHVLYTEPRKDIGRVRELLLEFDTTCEAMLTTPHRVDANTGEVQVYPEVARVARSLLSQADRFRSSVRGTAEGYLALWADEIVCQVTSASDFVVGDLVCLDKPMTLYLQPPPSDADRVRPLIRLMLNQIARALMENPRMDSRGRDKKHRLLMLIDEFPTLGRLQFFSENMRQMAGYGLKAQLVVQSFNDIVEAYGPHNTIIDNCHLLITFASADTITQDRISRMTGQVVEYRDSYSRPRSIFAQGQRTVSVSEHVRPLLQPGEVRTFPTDEQLIFVTGIKPLRTEKLRYYQDKRFTQRLIDPPTRSQSASIQRDALCDWHGERAKGDRLPLPEDMRASCSQGNPPPTNPIPPVGASPVEDTDTGDQAAVLDDYHDDTGADV